MILMLNLQLNFLLYNEIIVVEFVDEVTKLTMNSFYYNKVPQKIPKEDSKQKAFTQTTWERTIFIVYHLKTRNE